MGRLQEALEGYEVAMKDHLDDVICKNGRAETLRALGRLSEALDGYEAAMTAHPEDAFARNGRGCVLIAMRRFAEALKLLPSQLPGDFNGWIGLHIRGMCLLKQRKLPEAIEVLQLGHEQCPWPSSQQYFASALGLARLQLGGTKAASELLAEMDEQQPTDSPQYKVEAAAGPRLVRLHLLGVCKRVKGSEARVRTTPRDAAAHRL